MKKPEKVRPTVARKVPPKAVNGYRPQKRGGILGAAAKKVY